MCFVAKMHLALCFIGLRYRLQATTVCSLFCCNKYGAFLKTTHSNVNINYMKLWHYEIQSLLTSSTSPWNDNLQPFGFSVAFVTLIVGACRKLSTTLVSYSNWFVRKHYNVINKSYYICQQYIIFFKDAIRYNYCLFTLLIFNVSQNWQCLKDTYMTQDATTFEASGWYLRFSTKHIENMTARPVTNVPQSLATQTTCFSSETTQCSAFFQWQSILRWHPPQFDGPMAWFWGFPVNTI